MAVAGRHGGEPLTRDQARADAEPLLGEVSRRLVMSAEDMPRFGMHEPVVARSRIWVRLLVVTGAALLCWAMLWLAMSAI